MLGMVPPPGGLRATLLGTKDPIESVYPHMVRKHWHLLWKDLSAARMAWESAHASEP